MDFWDLTVLIFRRWKVALPLLLVAIAGTAYVALTAKPDYTMTAYVQFVPAKVAPNDNALQASARNPWNQLGLNTLGQAAVYATQDQQFLDSLKNSKHSTNFTLTITYPNPIVTVEVVGATPEDARETTELVIGRLRDSSEALQKQSGVQEADIIPTQRLDQGQNVVPSGGKEKRALAAAGAAGLLITVGGTVLFDALSRRRARKRADREQSEAPQVPEAPPVTAAGAASANGVPALPRGPMVQSDPDVTMIHPHGLVPSGNSGERPVSLAGTAPSASMERTAIVVRRGASAVKPPSTTKPARPPQTATYRSVNAQNEASGEDHDAPAATNGNSTPPSDVRVVLQPKWVGGENGGKSH